MCGPGDELLKQKSMQQEAVIGMQPLAEQNMIQQPLEGQNVVQVKIEDYDEQMKKQQEEIKRKGIKPEAERVNSRLVRNAKIVLPGVKAKKSIDEKLEDEAYGRPTYEKKKDRDKRIAKEKKEKKKLQKKYQQQNIIVPKCFDQRSERFLAKSDAMEKQYLSYVAQLREYFPRESRDLDRELDVLKFYNVNEQGEPLTEEDRLNKEWNDNHIAKLKEAYKYDASSEESKKIYFEAYDEIMEEVLDFQLDEANMFNPNYIIKNYEKIARFTRFGLSSSDTVFGAKYNRFEGYLEHIKEKPYFDLIDKKLKMLIYYGTLVRLVAQNDMGVFAYKVKAVDGKGTGITNDASIQQDIEMGSKEDYIEITQRHMADYKAVLNTYLKNNDPAMNENIAINGPISETLIEKQIRENAYRDYVEKNGHIDIRKFNVYYLTQKDSTDKLKRYLSDAKLKEKIQRANENSSGKKKKKSASDSLPRVDRNVVGFLKNVSFNLDGTPETAEDQAAHQWNVGFIDTFSKTKNAEQRKTYLRDIYKEMLDYEINDEMLKIPWVLSHLDVFNRISKLTLRESNLREVNLNKPLIDEIKKEPGMEKIDTKIDLNLAYINYIDFQLKAAGVDTSTMLIKEGLKNINDNVKTVYRGIVEEQFDLYKELKARFESA